jgi:hypothetical protein
VKEAKMTDRCWDCGQAHICSCRFVFGGEVPDFILEERRRKRRVKAKVGTRKLVLIVKKTSKSKKVHIKGASSRGCCGVDLYPSRQVWDGSESMLEKLKEEFDLCGRCVDAFNRKLAEDLR